MSKQNIMKKKNLLQDWENTQTEYYEQFNRSQIEALYSEWFGNNIDHYPYMEKYQMIDELIQDKEIKKIARAFDYQKTPYNLKQDLITYIKQNLYDDNISVQRFGKMYVFNWYFAPQTAGTLTQQMSYQALKIEQMTDKIIKHFSEVDNMPNKNNLI